MTDFDETDFLHGEYVRVAPMTRTEQIAIVGELNVRHGTDVPIAVIELAIVLGFTTWEALQREVNPTGCGTCGGAVPPGGDASTAIGSVTARRRAADHGGTVTDDEQEQLHRLRVALLARVNQWRFQAEHVGPDDNVTSTAVDERAQVLRECALELSALLPAEAGVPPPDKWQERAETLERELLGFADEARILSVRLANSVITPPERRPACPVP
jgi:hypothetical protein